MHRLGTARARRNKRCRHGGGASANTHARAVRARRSGTPRLIEPSLVRQTGRQRITPPTRQRKTTPRRRRQTGQRETACRNTTINLWGRDIMLVRSGARARMRRRRRIILLFLIFRCCNHRNSAGHGTRRRCRGADEGQLRGGGVERDSGGQRALRRAADGGGGVGCSR